MTAPSLTTQAKAARLLLTGAVDVDYADPGQFAAMVRGDHGRYLVTYVREWRCPCPWLGDTDCSHLLACQTIWSPTQSGKED